MQTLRIVALVAAVLNCVSAICLRNQSAALAWGSCAVLWLVLLLQHCGGK